jgi:SAM-dependent methyltransferase
MVADIERALPFPDQIRFDRIVCADVLEHVPYPQRLLEQLRRVISEDGLLIAAFPNIGHWSILDDLLQGRFDEAPSGILCVSHLRFGTRYSWENWLSRSGWEVLRWEAEKVPLPDHRRHGYPVQVGDKPVNFESLETFRFRIVARPTVTDQPTERRC